MNQTHIVGPREGQSNTPKVAALALAVALASALALAALALASVGAPADAAQGEILWKGDAEAPTNEQWSTIFTRDPYCGARPQSGIAQNNHGGYHSRVTTNPTPLQGNYAYKEVVDDSYECFQERTELSQNGTGNPKQYRPGDENWEAFGAWFGPDFNLGRDDQGASTVYQHKPIPSDNPNASIKVGNGNLQWVTQGGSPNNPDKDTTVIGTPVRGKWYRFVLHTKYSTGAGGLTELYSDVPGGPGGPIVRISSMSKPTMFSDTTAIRANMGFYRDMDDSGRETLAHDGFTVGTTRAIVEDNAF